MERVQIVSVTQYSLCSLPLSDSSIQFSVYFYVCTYILCIHTHTRYVDFYRGTLESEKIFESGNKRQLESFYLCGRFGEREER